MKKAIFLVVFLIFTLFSYKYFQSHIFTFHFVDEDENIIAGYYMGKGEKLYKDIFSHKQPLPAIISMYEQKIQKPNSLYLLIKRHREIVYFHSIIWTVILILVFNIPGLLFGIFFEITKQFQLGNLFLYESLVVFPLVFTLGYLWKMFTNNRDSSRSHNLSKIETIIFTISLSLIPFLQFTLLPYFLAVIILLFFTKKITKFVLCSLLFFIFFLLIFCSVFADYAFYLDNTINAIKSIYIGGSAAGNPYNIIYYSIFRPITSILAINKGDFGRFISLLSIGYLLSFLYLFITQKKYRKFLFTTFILLDLTILRLVYPDKTFYSGFHGLPWLGVFLFITIYQIYLIFQLLITNYSFKKIKYKIRNLQSVTVFIVLIIFSIIFIKNSFFLIKDYYRISDRETDWYVNFSRFYDYGQAIRILSQKGDEMMVLPVEQLIYWQARLPHATRFLYGYLFGVSKYKKELYEYWEKKPPAFIYDETNLDLVKKWSPLYQKIKQGDKDSPLFIRKDKIITIKPWQINELKRLNFSVDDKSLKK